MSSPPSAAELIKQWAERLDRMDYFQILRVERPKAIGAWPSDEELRRAFAVFAQSFHPDRYKHEDAETQALVTTIFRRGNEALRVLLNPGLRGRYVRHLVQGKMRLEGEEMTRKPTVHAMEAQRPPSNPPSSSTTPKAAAELPKVKIESLVTTQAALPFAKAADTFLARGEYKKALLQLSLVKSKEPPNEELDRIVDAVSARAK